MAKWYPAHNYTPADNYSLQAVPNPGAYTDLVTGDMALVYNAALNTVSALVYDSTSAAVEDIPNVVTPDGNAGNGRWLITNLGRVNEISQLNSSVVVTDAGAGSIAVSVDGTSIADFSSTGFKLENGATRVDAILDQDSMTNDDATALATQQSIKAYVDNSVHTQGTDTTIIQGNTGVNITDAGVGEILFTADGSSVGDFSSAGFRLGDAEARVDTILDEDDLASNDENALVTQQSVKAYVDNWTNRLATQYTTSGAIDVTEGFVELDSTAGDIAMTYAAPQKGRTVVFSCKNADNAITVTLGSGGFFYTDSGITDTGTVATFTTVGQCLVVFGQTSVRYVVTTNIDNVGIE